MKIAIVAHYSRAEQAQRLADQVGGVIFMDEGNNGAAWNHKRALEWAATQSDRVVVMEDDAEPVIGFVKHVGIWVDRLPDRLISFYLGKSRPPQYQDKIRKALSAADKVGDDYITLLTLIHGVAYSIPANKVAGVLARLRQGPADFAIGQAWRSLTGRDVVYTVPSLVDHADGESIERHPDGQKRMERRRAWRMYGEAEQIHARAG